MLPWQHHYVSIYFIPPSLSLPLFFFSLPFLPLLFFSSSSPSLLLPPPPPLYSRPFPSFSLFTFNTLSSIPFVSSATSTNPLGRGGEVAEEFSFLVKAMWSGQYRSVSPRDFKVTFEFCFVLLCDVFWLKCDCAHCNGHSHRHTSPKLNIM